MINKTDASYDEALAETAHLLNSDPSLSIDDPTLPHNQYFAIENVKALEDSAKKDKFFLMKAIDICAKHGVVMPEWVARSYRDAFREVTSLNIEKNSWDAVFGTPYPKSTQMDALRKRRLRFDVYHRVINALKKHPELATDDYLFEQIGKKFCISGAVAKGFYYEVKDKHEFKQPKRRGRPRKGGVISESEPRGQFKIVVYGSRDLKIKT